MTLGHRSTHETSRPSRPAIPPLRLDPDIESCIAACVACHAICLQTVFQCLAEGGPRASARHVRTLLDCAELCESAVHFMFADSALQSRMCALCADACRACERACRDMGGPQDLRCAEACACCTVMLHHAHPRSDGPLPSDGW